MDRRDFLKRVVATAAVGAVTPKLLVTSPVSMLPAPRPSWNWDKRIKPLRYLGWSKNYRPRGPLENYIAYYRQCEEPFYWQAIFRVFLWKMPLWTGEHFEKVIYKRSIACHIYLPGYEPIPMDPTAILFNATTNTVEYSPYLYARYQAEGIERLKERYPRWAIPGCEADLNKARKDLGRFRNDRADIGKLG